MALGSGIALAIAKMPEKMTIADNIILLQSPNS